MTHHTSEATQQICDCLRDATRGLFAIATSIGRLADAVGHQQPDVCREIENGSEEYQRWCNRHDVASDGVSRTEKPSTNKLPIEVPAIQEPRPSDSGFQLKGPATQLPVGQLPQ